MVVRKPSRVDRATEPEAERTAVSPPPAPLQRILALQRTAGNRAVAGMLQRDPLPVRDPLPPKDVPGQPPPSTWLTAIQMLRSSRIEAWRKTASSPEPRP